MAQEPKVRICRHCREPFLPNPRNRNRQVFCQKPACRKASKEASQQAWLEKNPDYFHGWEHAERIRTWRQAHPRRPSSKAEGRTTARRAKSDAAHPHSNPRPAGGTPHDPAILFAGTEAVLQDFVHHNPLMLGIIGTLCGCVLQDDFEKSIALLLRRGAAAQRRLQGG